MSYAENKARARTRTTTPTETDQSQASMTDRNIVVQRFLTHGQTPSSKQPMYGDFSRLPQDLRGFINQAKGLETLRARLPKALQGYTMQELLALKPAEITRIITPPQPVATTPATTPAPKEETK